MEVFHSGCDSFPPIQTKLSAVIVLVVRRNMLKHSANGMLWWGLGRRVGQVQYG
jgi:hypothetical protein